MNDDLNSRYNYTYPDGFDPEQYDPEVLEQIRRARIRREKADQLARDRLHAEMIMVGAAILIILFIVSLITRAGNNKNNQTFSTASVYSSQSVSDKSSQPQIIDADSAVISSDNSSDSIYTGQAEGHNLVVQDGLTYVDGILIVNKTFSLPSDYNPGLNSEAEEAFNSMAAQAWGEGVTLWICSGYRSYSEQETLFDSYATERGLEEADSVSARPGYSEHQTGLCMDINSTDFSFSGTTEAIWLENNCADYGFIIRFPEGKEDITGYDYEPWHIRYVGVEAAQAMKATGQCLEEYLNVTSNYADSPDNAAFVAKYTTSSTDENTADTTYTDGYNTDTDTYTYNTGDTENTGDTDTYNYNYDTGTDNNYTDNGYNTDYTYY